MSLIVSNLYLLVTTSLDLTEYIFITNLKGLYGSTSVVAIYQVVLGVPFPMYESLGIGD